jgi:hypothetical protein
MARDLAIFLQPLEAAIVGEGEPPPDDGEERTSGPGLDSTDPRLISITGLATAGKLATAADQIEELFAQKIYDIRLIAIYLFTAFREGGTAVLPTVLTAVSHLLEEGFEVVGPERKREENFDRRLAWLCEEIADALEYHEQKRTPQWEEWAEGLTAEVLAEAITHADVVGDKIAARGLQNAARGFAQLRSWLYSHRAPAAPVVEASSPGAGAGQTPRSSVRPMAAPTALGPDGSRLSLELVVSHRFLELRDKLRAFEILVEKKEFRKAALVADDVQQIVEHFDPRSYFPEVFAGFSARLSKNIASLAEHWEERDTVAWKAMGQFYQVDLDGFVES